METAEIKVEVYEMINEEIVHIGAATCPDTQEMVFSRLSIGNLRLPNQLRGVASGRIFFEQGFFSDHIDIESTDSNRILILKDPVSWRPGEVVASNSKKRIPIDEGEVIYVLLGAMASGYLFAVKVE